MSTPKPQERPSKEEYYFNIALAVAMRSTCLGENTVRSS